MRSSKLQKRKQLLRQLGQLAPHILFGTLSETYRTCGQPTCRCRQGGPRHGPHLHVSYRGDEGKTSGYYVPRVLEEPVRGGIVAWQRFLAVARRLAELNRDRLWSSRVSKGKGR